jgi:hypothetical protein
MTQKLILLFCFAASLLCLPACFLPGRSKEKIYTNFFGKGNCAQLLEARDARALDDCCVWLHFKACPAEVKRILSLVPYETTPMT